MLSINYQRRKQFIQNVYAVHDNIGLQNSYYYLLVERILFSCRMRTKKLHME